MFAIASGIVVASVGAQDEPSRALTGHRVGPLLLAPSVTLQDVGLDSNVYNTVEQVADFTFTLKPIVGASTRWRRTAITLRSATDLVYFAQQTSERSVNQSFSGSFRSSLGRFAAIGTATYLNTRQRPTEEIDARSRRIGRTGEAGVEVSVTPKVTALLKGSGSWTEFDADAVFDGTFLAEELNRRSHAMTSSVRYAATRLTAVSMSGSITRARFDAARRDADARVILVGVDLHPRALISGSASFGYQHFRPLSANLPELRGAVGVAMLTVRLGTATALSVETARNVDYSYFEEQPYYIRQGYGASIRRQLATEWDVQLATSRFVHRYRRNFELEPGGDPDAGRSRLFQLGLTTGYRAGPTTRITVGLTYSNRQSSFLHRDYDNLRIGTAVSHAF
jgi:hypothetical protein